MPQIICFGSPLVDVIANTTEDFLKKYNLAPDTATSATTQHTNLFQELETMPTTLQVGGSVTNTARIIRWISGNPRAVMYFGAIGDDKFGEFVKKCLDEEHVNYKFCVSELPTGKCAVLLSGQQRTLCTDLLASKSYSEDHLKTQRVQKIVLEAKYVYFSAFFFSVCAPTVVKLARQCSLEGKLFMLNLGAHFLCDKFRDELLNVHPYVDVLFGNEMESRAFAKIHSIADGNLEVICRKLNTLRKVNERVRRLTVITRANKPILVAKDGFVDEFTVPEIDESSFKDTNGAGDAFVGGFLTKFIQNCSVNECVRCGIWAAREIIANVGCNFNKDHVYEYFCLFILSIVQIVKVIGSCLSMVGSPVQ